MQKLTQVVGQGDEVGLHFLCVFALRPRFGFSKLVLNFIKHLFDPPAHEVELGNHAGWDFDSQIGEKAHGFSSFWQKKADPPDHVSLTVADPLIREDTHIEGIGVIIGNRQRVLQFHIRFGAREEVDARVVFPLAPLPKVDACAVPDVEDFFAFGRSLAEVFGSKSF